MKKHNKKIQQGVVNLNEPRLGSNKNTRPSVLPNKKIPKDNNTKTNDNVKKTIPSITSKNKNINSIGNVKEYKNNSKQNFINRDKNGKLLISRRTFIYGAIGAGSLIAIGAGTKFVTDKVKSNNTSINTLEVPKQNIISSDNLLPLENTNYLSVNNEYILPYGSLAWANSSNIVSCLIPTNLPKPIATVDFINTKTGNKTTILHNSIKSKHGFEIYDVRANQNAIIWTEANILQGEWRVYASTLDSEYNINHVMLDTGKSQWETPSIAITDSAVYWQVLPKPNGFLSNMYSSLKKCKINKLTNCGQECSQNVITNSDIQNNKYTIYTSQGRMSTPVNSFENGVVITPRLSSNNIIYQLTYINENDEVEDSIALPQNMKPLEASYGNTGFNFAFDAIYNYGEGISNLGTYTPITKSKNDYTNKQWLNFNRVPTAAPAWCNNLFIVRSSMSVVAIDLNTQNYSVLDRPNASDDYGDYLASSGKCSQIVTYANVYDQPVSGEDKKYCNLRIWEQT